MSEHHATQTGGIDATETTSGDDPLLSIRDLEVEFKTDDGIVKAVDGISFDVPRGETVCIVGESGSGKTVTSESITQLIPQPPGRIKGGEVLFDGQDLRQASDKQLKKVRGKRIAHIFQDPQGALNPVYTVGWQIAEAVNLHNDVTKKEARERVVDLLDKVGIPEPASRLDDYPHEFSGGQKQRVIIAMALAGDPDLLIADEPTTALDVTIQAQILRLLRELQESLNMSILLVTHDLGVVAEMADKVVVMYAGKKMEEAGVYEMFEQPAHPYTQAMLDCLPGSSGQMDSIEGEIPSLIDPPAGCRFHPRCDQAVEECRQGVQPAMEAVGDNEGHEVSCVHYGGGKVPDFSRRVWQSRGGDQSGSVGGHATDGGVDRGDRQ